MDIMYCIIDDNESTPSTVSVTFVSWCLHSWFPPQVVSHCLIFLHICVMVCQSHCCVQNSLKCNLCLKVFTLFSLSQTFILRSCKCQFIFITRFLEVLRKVANGNPCLDYPKFSTSRTLIGEVLLCVCVCVCLWILRGWVGHWY